MPASSSQSGLRVRVERGIYKRRAKDGKTIRYEIAYQDSDGRQRWRTVARLQEARDLRAELTAKVNSGERVAPSKQTLHEYGDEWLKGQRARLRPSTHARYTISLSKHVYPRLGHQRLADVTVNDVARLIAEMEREGKAAWTIRGVLVALGRVLSSAEREGAINANPVRKLERGERPKVKRTQFPELDTEAIGRLIEGAPERYRALIATSILTGLRQGEALGLQWRDVDVKAGTISVRRQLDRQGNLVDLKTDAATRDVPIAPSLGRLLTAHKTQAFEHGHAKPDDLVFCSLTGGPLAHHNVGRRGLEKALEAAGLPHLRWHDLRHVCASVMISQGASVAYLSRLLGHANPSITLSMYAHQFAKAEHAANTREQMEAAFGQLLG